MEGDSTQSLLTISQAGRLLGIHPDTLRRWEKQGKLRSVRVGSRKDRRYNIQDLLSLITTDNQPLVIVDKDKVRAFQQQNEQDIIRLVKKATWIFFDVGYTLAALFPSRGDIYSDVAYSFGFNLDPFTLDKNYYRVLLESRTNNVLSKMLIRPSEETIDRYYGKFNAEILISSGFPRSMMRLATEIGRTIYHTVMSNDATVWRTFTHTQPLLEALRGAGKKLAIVENWDNGLLSLLEAWHISNYFSFVICGGALRLRKPDPEIFKLALKKAGAKPNEVVYIGDSYEDDVLGAKSAGIVTILYDWHRLHMTKQCYKIYTFEHILSSLSQK